MVKLSQTQWQTLCAIYSGKTGSKGARYATYKKLRDLEYIKYDNGKYVITPEGRKKVEALTSTIHYDLNAMRKVMVKASKQTRGR